MRLWDEDRKTVVMVTRDVDVALLLADRVVMMTSGPDGRGGERLTVPFPRPRSRAAMLQGLSPRDNRTVPPCATTTSIG